MGDFVNKNNKVFLPNAKLNCCTVNDINADSSVLSEEPVVL